MRVFSFNIRSFLVCSICLHFTFNSMQPTIFSKRNTRSKQNSRGKDREKEKERQKTNNNNNNSAQWSSYTQHWNALKTQSVRNMIRWNGMEAKKSVQTNAFAHMSEILSFIYMHASYMYNRLNSSKMRIHVQRIYGHVRVWAVRKLSARERKRARRAKMYSN